MARIESYEDAIERIKQSFLTHQDAIGNNEIFDSITKK